jgi:phosphatidylglycerol:prolipoprotein diacylglycerol transferase
MLYLGLLAGVVAGNVAAHAAGLDPLRVYVATLILIVPALIGARLLYVAAHWYRYRRDLACIWDRSQGGWSMYGGLPGAVLLSLPLLRALRLSFGAYWDVAVFTILVGMVFTRIGCLLNGCCAGRPSSMWLSIYLPNHRGLWQKRIPTQLLEALWAAVLLLAALALRKSVPFPGGLFLLIAAAYGSGRFLMEFARERECGEASFSLEHFLSLLTVCSSVAGLVIHW